MYVCLTVCVWVYVRVHACFCERVCVRVCLSLPLFLFIRVRCCLQLFHRLICYSSPPFSVSCLLLPLSLLSCRLHIPRLLLPCSSNSVALFGSLSSVILSTCPAHCNLLLLSLSVKLLYTPVSSLNSTILRLSALVTLAIFLTQFVSRILAACVVVRSEPRFPLRTGELV